MGAGLAFAHGASAPTQRGAKRLRNDTSLFGDFSVRPPAARAATCKAISWPPGLGTP